MTDQPAEPPDDLRTFLLVVRRALLLVVGYIEERYGLGKHRPPGDVVG